MCIPFFVQDVSSEGLRVVLDAMYTGKVLLSESTICDTLTVAHHLQFQPLLNVCEEYFVKHLSPSNCLEFLETGERLCLDLVIKESRSYILKNFSSVSQEETYLDMGKDDLVSYLGADNLLCEEGEVAEAVIKWLDHSDERLVHAKEIAGKVRFGLLTMEQLVHFGKKVPAADTLLSFSRTLEKKKASDDKDATDSDPTCNWPEYEPRGIRTYAMIIRKRTNPHRWANDGSTDKIAFLNEVMAEKAMKFEGWYDSNGQYPLLDSSVVSFVHNHFWYIYGVVTPEYVNFMARYDSRKNKWSQMHGDENVALGRAGFQLGDRLYIVGGSQICQEWDEGVDKEIGALPLVNQAYHVFDIKTSEMRCKGWSAMPYCATFAAACEHNGVGYFIGGYGLNESVHRGAEFDDALCDYQANVFACVIDGDSETWTQKKSLNRPRYGATAGSIGDYVVVVGGLVEQRNQPEEASELYDPRTDQWSFMKGDPTISQAIKVPTLTGFGVLKSESYPLQYFDVDEEGKVISYRKESQPAVGWMPGKDHWAYIIGSLLTVAPLVMMPNKKAESRYKLKESFLTLVKRT